MGSLRPLLSNNSSVARTWIKSPERSSRPKKDRIDGRPPPFAKPSFLETYLDEKGQQTWQVRLSHQKVDGSYSWGGTEIIRRQSTIMDARPLELPAQRPG